jgi:hypothetical protein
MNDLANMVSDALLGEMRKTIFWGGKYHTVNALNGYTLARMIKPLSRIDVDENESQIGTLQKQVAQGKYIDEAIAIAIMGNRYSRLRKWLLMRRVKRSDSAEQLEAFKEVSSLISGQHFFLSARLAMQLVKMMAKQKSSEDQL